MQKRQELSVPELVHGHESKQEASIKYGLFHEHKESETQSPGILHTDSGDGDHFCPTPTSASAFCLSLRFPSPNSHPPSKPRSHHTASNRSELPGTYLLGVAPSLAAQWQSSDVILKHATHQVSRTSVLFLVSGLIQILGDCKGRPDRHRAKAGS